MSLIERKTTKDLHKLENNTLKVRYTDKFKLIYNLFCSANPKVEWSGVLFYRIDKAVDNNIEIELLDIQLMDIGTGAYTEYKFDGSIGDLAIKYLFTEENNVHMGHIHSHNSMPVFFSGTDNQELIDNSEEHFMYLSVIVNNNLDIIARAVIKEEVTHKIVSSGSLLFKDSSKTISYPRSEEKSIKLWFYEAEMIYEEFTNEYQIPLSDLDFYLKSLREVNAKEKPKTVYKNDFFGGYLPAAPKNQPKQQNKTKQKQIQYKSDMAMSNDYSLVKQLLVDATHLVGNNQQSILANITMAVSHEIEIKEIAEKSITSLIELLEFNNAENMYDCLHTAKIIITTAVAMYPNVQNQMLKELAIQTEAQSDKLDFLIEQFKTT